MIRKILKPKSGSLEIEIPEEYIGRDVEILVFAIEKNENLVKKEENNEKSQKIDYTPSLDIPSPQTNQTLEKEQPEEKQTGKLAGLGGIAVASTLRTAFLNTTKAKVEEKKDELELGVKEKIQDIASLHVEKQPEVKITDNEESFSLDTEDEMNFKIQSEEKEESFSTKAQEIKTELKESFDMKAQSKEADEDEFSFKLQTDDKEENGFETQKIQKPVEEEGFSIKSQTQEIKEESFSIKAQAEDTNEDEFSFKLQTDDEKTNDFGAKEIKKPLEEESFSLDTKDEMEFKIQDESAEESFSIKSQIEDAKEEESFSIKPQIEEESFSIKPQETQPESKVETKSQGLKVTKGTIDLSMFKAKSSEPKTKFTKDDEEYEPIKNVLVAEDNMINQKLITKILEGFDLNVTIASNGLLAFQQRQENDFDLIFIDISMPIMDGIESIHNIIDYEKENDLQHTPIIALTANALNGDRERFLKEGADEYITKPIKRDKISYILDLFTSKRPKVKKEVEKKQEEVKEVEKTIQEPVKTFEEPALNIQKPIQAQEENGVSFGIKEDDIKEEIQVPSDTNTKEESNLTKDYIIDTEHAPSKDILICRKSSMETFVAKSIVTQIDASCDSCDNLEEFYNKFKSNHYSLVMFDYEIPELDTYKLSEIISKAQKAYGKDINTVMLVSNNSEVPPRVSALFTETVKGILGRDKILRMIETYVSRSQFF